MGLFGRGGRKGGVDEEESSLRTELEDEVEGLQKKFRESQAELAGLTAKTAEVRREYDTMVSSLMLVKKELYEKKLELGAAKKEYERIMGRNREEKEITEGRAAAEFKRTRGEQARLGEEIAVLEKKKLEVIEETRQEQSALRNVTKQRIDTEMELEEANSRLYNAKQELDGMDAFEDTGVLTRSEIEAIGAGEGEPGGVIEAASAVVGSLKSKLDVAQRELDAVQTLLQEERREHGETKRRLEEQSGKKP